MKKIIIFIMCIIFIFSFSSCSKVALAPDDSGILNFIYGEQNINTEVKEDDLETIKEIFNNKILYSDNPSCGFSKNISVIIGNKTFCFACDGCKIIYLLEENKYFSLSEKEYETLNQVLFSYGMYFPCT